MTGHEMLHDNLHGIKMPAIRCFARRASVKRISGFIYEEIRGVLKVFPENVICDVTAVNTVHSMTALSTASVFLIINSPKPVWSTHVLWFNRGGWWIIVRMLQPALLMTLLTQKWLFDLSNCMILRWVAWMKLRSVTESRHVLILHVVYGVEVMRCNHGIKLTSQRFHAATTRPMVAWKP